MISWSWDCVREDFFLERIRWDDRFGWPLEINIVNMGLHAHPERKPLSYESRVAIRNLFPLIGLAFVVVLWLWDGCFKSRGFFYLDNQQVFLAVNICLQCTNYSGDLALPEGGLYYSVTAAYRVMLLLCCIVIATFYYLITMLREGDIYFLLFFSVSLGENKIQYFRSLLPPPPPPKKNSLGKVNGIILCIDIYPRNFNPIFCLRSKIWLRQCYSNLCFWTDIRIDKRCKFTPIPHATVYGVVRAWARKTTALPSRQLAYQQAP